MKLWASKMYTIFRRIEKTQKNAVIAFFSNLLPIFADYKEIIENRKTVQ